MKYIVSAIGFLLMSTSFVQAESNWSRVNACSYPNQDTELVDRLLSKMTLEEKVGQIIQGDLDFMSPEDVRNFNIGSVLNGGNSSPNKNKYSSVDDWKNLSKAFFDASPVIDGVKIPVLWGTDAVHGHNNLIGATLFPHNIGLGATKNPELLKSIGEAIALEVLSTGVMWTFAPTIAVPQDLRWGRTYEGFSENPQLVSDLGAAMILGLQGEGTTLLDKHHVIATAKHFMGDGGTLDGVDQGNTVADESIMRDVHGFPYFAALDACSQTVMASFNSLNGEKLHGAKHLLTDILKTEMQFDGFVVGDWNGHGQVQNCTNMSCAQSFNAGVDIFMVPENWKELYQNSLKQVSSGEIPLKRLNDAVRRILTVKSRAGLLSGRRPHEFKGNYLGHPKHRVIARQAVRESLVLLKNNNSILPVSPKQHIGVIGSAANKISSQTGGWTITWQGRENTNSDFQNTQTIFEALSDAVGDGGGSIEFSVDGKFTNTPDVVIGIFGEEPYAEMLGDLKNVSFQPTDPEYLNQLTSIASAGIPIVSIFLSGRPLVVNAHINYSDAFVAAWLPGTAVEGIGDVIFSSNGTVNYDFVGSLPFSWPMHSSEGQLNAQDPSKVFLFPYGFGLNYSSAKEMDQILASQDSAQFDEVNIFLGAASIPGKEVVITSSGAEFVQEDDFLSSDKAISINRFEYRTQDDSKNIEVAKSDAIQAYGISSESILDLSLMESPYYELILRINNEAPAPLYLSVGCGSNCHGSIELPINEIQDWTPLNVPVSCLEQRGLDKSKIKTRGLFLTSGLINFDLHSIKIKEGEMEGLQVKC